MSRTMPQLEDQQRRDSLIAGHHHQMDDDVPRPPEPCPMSSAQSRRAWPLPVVITDTGG